MIGWKKDFFNCKFTFTFQPDGCAEPTCATTCFIHFVISNRLDNIRLMMYFFSSETFALSVFICFFIYSFYWWVGLKCICKSEEISVYNKAVYISLHANTIEKDTNLPHLCPQRVELSRLTCLTSLGEGKCWRIQISFTPLKNWPCVIHRLWHKSWINI